MDPDSRTSSRLRDIFLNAADIEDQRHRTAYLDQACANDLSLRRRVEALLAAEAQAGPPSQSAPRSSLTDDPVLGSRIGHYKLLQQIGEGGCGTVYMAEQQEPFRRRVALKIIKLGMDTKQVVARFEAERQALALMDHPNIARVHDAGATETGRPYFVMELVRGIKITDYCDEHQFSTRQRLHLFTQVCHAVQHAHQKGIIHRDLKPSNVLVTEVDGKPIPKIIDFGIAKAVEGRLTDNTLFTAFEQLVGTPSYMSPEQASLASADIDTRTDVYSLGVMLYQLLTGETPFDTKALLAAGLDEMRRTIAERMPARPSARWTTMAPDQVKAVARARGVEPSRFPHVLADDLDWIVMKCLEKDRRRRYETANGLAMDVQRHLNNEPIVARPPSRIYEFQKTVRRHWVGFAATAAVVAALCVGVLISRQEATRARRAEYQALAQAYASDMNVAMHALRGKNLGRARDMLERYRPNPGQADLRDWEWRYLWDQTRNDALFNLCRLPSAIISIAASQDARWIAVGGAHQGGLEVWDLTSRTLWARLSEMDERALATFSPTEPLLAYTSVQVSESGERRSALHLWDAATKTPRSTHELDAECVGLAFSKDGRSLVTSTSSGDHGHITLWQVPDGTQLAEYPTDQFGDEITPTGFAATSDLTIAAYAVHKEYIRLLDLRNGRVIWAPKVAPQLVIALAFSPDGNTLATAGGFAREDVRLWDIDSQTEIRAFKGHSAYVSSLEFTPDGNRLIASSGDQQIYIWDVKTGALLDVLHGHRQEVMRLKPLMDGKRLVSGSKIGVVSLWDITVAHPRKDKLTIPIEVKGWSFDSDSRSVLTLDWEGRVDRWSGTDLRQRETLLRFDTNSNILVRDSISGGGSLLAAGSSNGVVQLWDLAQRRLAQQLIDPDGGLIHPVRFDRDEKLLLTVSDDQILRVWDLELSRVLRSWPKLGGSVNVAEGSFRSNVVEVAFNRNLRFTPLPNGLAIVRQLDYREIGSATFSHHGRLFAGASHDGYARIWDAATWDELATLSGFLLGLDGVAFSPDDRRVATSGGSEPSEALTLWDTETWLDVLTLECQGSHFVRISFSPDGSAIGMMDTTRTLNIWRAPGWEEIEAAETVATSP